jgi:uncharacterized protein
MSVEFTPFSALAGGALIGLSASAMLLVEGRVAGISGIVGGLAPPKAGDLGWRLAFLAGLVAAGALALLFHPAAMAVEIERGPLTLVLAGLLVGVGTRLGNGCTSGHGVCGLSRRSPRSLASVLTFMGVGMVVAVLVGRLGGPTP